MCNTRPVVKANGGIFGTCLHHLLCQPVTSYFISHGVDDPIFVPYCQSCLSSSFGYQVHIMLCTRNSPFILNHFTNEKHGEFSLRAVPGGSFCSLREIWDERTPPPPL